jgi:hypothetical protein
MQAYVFNGAKLNSNVDEANKNSKLVVTFMLAVIFELHKCCDPRSLASSKPKSHVFISKSELQISAATRGVSSSFTNRAPQGTRLLN